MEVFRISSAKWAGILQSSGRAARWNSNNIFITYTASTRALSCLEMLVHLSGEHIKMPFKLSVIYIPDNLPVENFTGFYKKDWAEFEYYHDCQLIGDEWAKSQRTCILRVPSAIIKNEFNYLINPQHPDFKLIKVIELEDFEFDMRLKG
jgi:RES domain-containing protein